MIYKQLITLSFFLLILPQAFGHPQPGESPVADLVERITPGVVNLQIIQIRQESVIDYGGDFDDFFNFFGMPGFRGGFPTQRAPRKLVSRGSGFVIDSSGYIVTNHHVIAGANEVIVVLADQTQLKAKVIGSDKKYDLALIKVKKNKKYKALKLGDSNQTRIGEDIIAIGNPFGLQHTVTKGIVSAKHRTIGAGPFDDFLQTDSAINPGNSGGPMFNLRGEVIGVNTMIRKQAQGIGFAIPINVVKTVVADLKKHGRVLRQWLGIVGNNVSNFLPHTVGGHKKGVIIVNLVKGTPADKQGLAIGDVILEVNRKPISNVYDLQRTIEMKRDSIKATKLLLKIARGKKEFIKLIKLEIIPKEEELPRGYHFL